jgi:uncharacterized protein YjdB
MMRASSLAPFGFLHVPYTQPAAHTVTITNTGPGPITLTQPVAVNYDIGALSTTTISVNGTATFTVRPKANLAIGSYYETIIINGSNGASTLAMASFTVVRDPIYVREVTLDRNNATIFTGGTLQLTATVNPSNYTIRGLTWSSDNPRVATVNETGLVTATATPGSASITVRATDGGFEATCRVSVTVPVSRIVITPAAISIDVGDSYFLTAAVDPFNASNSNLVWSSDNVAVATVNQGGIVTTVAAGRAIITATAADGSGVFDTCTVNAIPVLTTGVTLNENLLILHTGISETLIATVLPANATDKRVTWYSDNIWVATVSDTGLVTTIRPGFANITVRTLDGGLTATCRVQVVTPVTRITINPSTVTIRVGESGFLWVDVEPSNASNINVFWSSNNEAIATVSQGGVVRGVAAGTATITATAADGSGVTGTRVVNVTSELMLTAPVLPAGLISIDAVAPIMSVPVDPADATAAIDMLSTMMPGINSSDLHVDRFGVITIKDSIAQSIAENLLGGPVSVLTLPVFEAVVGTPGNIAVVAFDIEGRDLMASRPDRVNLLKLISSDHGEFFRYVSSYAELGDKAFTVQDMSNNIFSGDIVPGNTYRLVIAIKDGGDFDLDRKN